MKRAIQAQIKCGGLSPEGQYFRAAKACGMTLAALVAFSCADAPKVVEPVPDVIAVYEFHEVAPSKIIVYWDDGQMAGIGIRINGSTYLKATVKSGDLNGQVIQNPDWKKYPITESEE